METTITSHLDEAIDQYKAQHGGSSPLFCIMSADEADELTASLRRKNGQDDDVIITTYRDIKIVRDGLRKPGEYIMANELPETGS